MAVLSFIAVVISVSQMTVAQSPSATVPPVDFFKEEITMTIGDSTASIQGIYYFRNNTGKDRRFPVVFPFYIDKASHFPDEINAYIINKKDTTTINFEPLIERGAIRMAIPMRPDSITIWHLDYTQPVDSPHARYILTSTAAWKKPLEEADYYFVVPSTWDITGIWPAPDSVESGRGADTLKCARRDFMPDRDMEIFWQVK